MVRDLILGASGFIGRNLAQALPLGTLAFPRENLYSIKKSTTKFGRVFYCLGDDSGVVEPNLGYLLWFLKNCQFQSLIYLSSTRVYLGATTGSEDSELRLSPSDPGYHFNVVKLAAEAACLADERCKVVRLSTVIGTQGTYLIPELIRQARNGEINLYLPHDFIRDLITIEDVVEMLPKIANGRHRLYNLGSGTNTAIGEIVQAIGVPTIWHPHKQMATFPKVLINRIEAEFDFKPRSPLEALRTQVEACR